MSGTTPPPSPEASVANREPGRVRLGQPPP